MVPICLGTDGHLFFSILLAIGQFSRRGNNPVSRFLEVDEGRTAPNSGNELVETRCFFQNRNNLLQL